MFNFSSNKNTTPHIDTEGNDLPKTNSDNVINNISNWYSDKYATTIVQRNFMIIIVLLSLLVVIVSVIIVGSISSTFKIQPFVIEVEDKTGITNIVNPLDDNVITANQTLNKYFITKYIKARESYAYESWRYNYLTVVRLLSTANVYFPFRRFINVDPNSPLALYGNQTSTSIAFRSLQFFPPSPDRKGKLSDPQAVVRFTIYADKGNLRGAINNRINKIATLTYKYQQTEMNDDDRMVNPLGFYITTYRADIENDVVPVIKNNETPSD